MKWWPTCRAKRIGLMAKARVRQKAKVELVVKIRAGYVGFLVVEIIYCGSARAEILQNFEEKPTGKLSVWPLFPIQNGHQEGLIIIRRVMIERQLVMGQQRVQRVRRGYNKKNKRKEEKTISRFQEVLARQVWQAPGPTQINMVVGVEP